MRIYVAHEWPQSEQQWCIRFLVIAQLMLVLFSVVAACLPIISPMPEHNYFLNNFLNFLHFIQFAISSTLSRVAEHLILHSPLVRCPLFLIKNCIGVQIGCLENGKEQGPAAHSLMNKAFGVDERAVYEYARSALDPEIIFSSSPHSLSSILMPDDGWNQQWL